MRPVATVLLAGLMACSGPGIEGARTPDPEPAAPAGAELILLVRHAEAFHEPGGDPALTSEGEARAKRLAVLLADAGIRVIHSTPYRRTTATVAPLAEALGLVPILHDPREPDALVQRALRERGPHLVVGHSNTLPDLVRRLGGAPGPDIRSDEHDRLYVVHRAGDSVRTLILRY
jgi:phosphohistidine phosphatase SixA